MSWLYIEVRWLAVCLMAMLSAMVPAVAWAGDSAVQITVHVPAGARLWFDGHETTQTGAERVFASPPLEPGRDFAYDVRAQWRDGEKMVERTRRLAVRAGDRIDLNLVESGSVAIRGFMDEMP